MFEKVPNQYRVRTIKVCLFSGLGERWYNFVRLPFGPKVSVLIVVSRLVLSLPVEQLIDMLSQLTDYTRFISTLVLRLTI